MARGPQNHSTEPRSSDPTLSLYLLVYETTPNDEFTLTLTNPGLPIVPSSPFYRTLQDLWSQHGNRDATPSVGLIRAVAADIQRQPRLWSLYVD
ncbi:hypothetical protein N7481_002561 [Penicillium waksmanii]|uniref:uncharacterized protein n=1 Tax=Penicillium waksmanii TaxID=69791 RepID=UPI0025475050|nr:uncharacterized protein N7481_002561 [Penicillium waksmanii]KAJ5995584.1 hypothetical protein N7481_002561 [Penicillium waksmanii]